VPKIFSTDDINTRSGAHFGDFRPTKAESTGGYRMSFDEEVLCKMVIPYQVGCVIFFVTKRNQNSKNFFCRQRLRIDENTRTTLPFPYVTF
jgi:hypothetical protein